MKKCMITLALAICLAIPQQAPAATELVFQGLNPTHPISKVMLALFEEIKAKSNGELDITFLQQGAIVKLEAAYTAVRDGTLDGGIFATNYTISLLPYSQGIAAPWIAKDGAHAARIQQALLKEIPEYNKEINDKLVLFGVWASERGAFLSNDKPIKSPEDLRGKRVLTWLPGLVDELKAWGATPVLVNNSDVYVGLQRGLGDAVYGSLPMVAPGKYYEVAKYITVVPPSSLTGTACAFNIGAWKELSADQQALVRETFGDLGLRIGDALVKSVEDDIEFFKKNGNEVYTLNAEEAGVFKSLSAPVIRAYWIEMLERNGMKNAGEYLDKVAAIAAAVQ